MPNDSQSFAGWLRGKISSVLDNTSSSSALFLWCDPELEWIEILQNVSGDGVFELWADRDEHELLLRDRFYREERRPRVVWIPKGREDITWFKVFELEADAVWEKTILQALREYGVDIPHEQEEDLRSMLGTYAMELLDSPKSAWQELSPGTAKGTLVDDPRMLKVLAGGAGEFPKLKEEELFSIFARRATEDFGLPDPRGLSEEDWRVTATARLLVTDGARCCPEDPPADQKHIIPSGPTRESALKLLDMWKNHIQYLDSFERLALAAEKTLSLDLWARNLNKMPESRSSHAVESTLFNQEADRLEAMGDVQALAEELKDRASDYRYRADGFWGDRAQQPVPWACLSSLADSATAIVDEGRKAASWKTADEATRWYVGTGWQLDHAGEKLYRESAEVPGSLRRVRARLRRAYLRAMDGVGKSFSRLIEQDSEEILSRPTAGERLKDQLSDTKQPTAIFILDAFRLELGNRLAEMLNEGEPIERAQVEPTLAPVPSVTSLGMSFALPLERNDLEINVGEGSDGFEVHADGFDGDLAVAEERRRWLKEEIGVAQCLNISDVIDGDGPKKATRKRNLIAVEGRRMDKEGHKGELQIHGTEGLLERYAGAIRRVREAGYRRVLITTDHGFFHWEPDRDESAEEKPNGEILWGCRRAMVGRDLEHPSAVILPVLSSDLEVAIPRSVNAFKTYGRLGFFHGGATLQEMIIPVVVATWPAKAQKTGVVLKPVGDVTTNSPRVQVQASVTGQTRLIADDKQIARRVHVEASIDETGEVLFQDEKAITVEPGGEPVIVELSLVEEHPTVKYGTDLKFRVRDADTAELLAQENVTLRKDIDDFEF